MSTTTWARHEKELPVKEIPRALPDSANGLGEKAPVTEAPDMSSLALKALVGTLLFGVVFLATLGAWMWYAVHQYQNVGGF